MRKNRVFALVGAPNSGKTTLYNWLTGSHFKTVNYPGATVDIAVGLSASRMGEPRMTILDTPGTYSLFAKSNDEEVTLQVLTKENHDRSVDGVLVVVDGTQMARHLLLARQLYQMRIPFVVAITMADLLRRNQIHLALELIEREFGAPVVPFDGVLGQGLDKIGEALRSLPKRQASGALSPWTDEEMAQQMAQLERLSHDVAGEERKEKIAQIFKATRSWDKILLHPVWGLVSFFLVMAFLFSSIFWLASPFQDAIDGGFSWMADQILLLAPGSLFAEFLANGLIRSFAAVLVFVPQIFILFFGIGIVESTGYLARAATLIDRPFSALGLTGRSFVPLLSGFACAVPAIMATRNLSSRRDRVITSFIIPLMVCSARLPVYALLIGFIFHGRPAWVFGLVLTGIYFCSLFIGALAALVLHWILPRKEPSLLMMELPLYRRPKWGMLLKQSLQRTQAYVRKAGPIIFVLAVLIWVGTTFPDYRNENKSDRFSASYMAMAGQKTEGLFRPMGADWRVGVGLISAFAAREVFVSTLALMMRVEGDEDSQQEGLLRAINEAKFSDGTSLFTAASITALIFFFMIALQCMSTFAIMGKELYSQKIAWIQLISFNVIAYVGAVLIYQVLS